MPKDRRPENPVTQPVTGQIIRRAFTCDEVRAINKEKRQIDFVISTDRVDRMGDIIDVKGWDLKEYRRNPVVLFAHNSRIPPIGRAIRIGKDTSLRATAEFMSEELSPFAYSIFRMYEEKYLKATSVGFNPIEWEAMEDDKGNFTGIKFKKQELLEFSAVPIPANPDALIEARSKGIDMEPMREWAEEVLAHWGDPEGALIHNLYGVGRKRMEEIYRKASGKGRSIVVPRHVQDQLLSQNLKAVTDKGKDDVSLFNALPTVTQDQQDAAGAIAIMRDGDEIIYLNVPKLAQFAPEILQQATKGLKFIKDGLIVELDDGAITAKYKLIARDPMKQTLFGFLEELKGRSVIPYLQAHPDGSTTEDVAAVWDFVSEFNAATVDDLMKMAAWHEDKAEPLTKDDFAMLHHKVTNGYPCVWAALSFAAACLPQSDIPEKDKAAIKDHFGHHYAEFHREAPWDRSPEEWGRYVEAAVKGSVVAARNLCKSLFPDVDALELWPLTDEEKAAQDNTDLEIIETEVKEDGENGDDTVDGGNGDDDKGDEDDTLEGSNGNDTMHGGNGDDTMHDDFEGEDVHDLAFGDEKDNGVSISDFLDSFDDTLAKMEEHLDTAVEKRHSCSRREARKLKYLASGMKEIAAKIFSLLGEEDKDVVGQPAKTEEPKRSTIKYDDLLALLRTDEIKGLVVQIVKQELNRARGRLD